MKHSKIIIFLFALTLLLTACGSGISTEEYAAIVSENTSLKAEIDSLSTENQSLSAENESLTKDLLNERTEHLEQTYPREMAKAWATTSFGDNSICFMDDDNLHLQCIAGNTYQVSDDGIASIYSDFIASIKTLALVQNTFSCETVSVKFLDPSGICILEFTLEINADSAEVSYTLCNAIYANAINSALDKILN